MSEASIVPSASGGPSPLAVPTRPAGRPRSLGSNVAWTLVGNIGYAACQWAILVVLAKLGSPEQVGQFALGLGLTAPIMLLSNLNLRAVQASDTTDLHAFGDYLRLRIVTTVVALAACLAIAAFGRLSLQTALVVGFVGLAKAAESLSDIYYGRFQKHERMDRVARSMLVRGMGSLAALSLLVWITGSVVWGAGGLFLAWLAVLVGYDMRSPLRERDRVRMRTAWRTCWTRDGLKALAPLAWLALPLGIVQMLVSLNVNVPRFFIQGSAGEHALGIYSAIAYITLAGSMLVTSLGQAVGPRLAQLHAAGERAAFTRLLGTLALACTAGCALAVAVVLVAGRWLLTILYTPEYAAEWPILLLLTLAVGVGALVSIAEFGITAARRFRAQVPLVGIAVAVVTVASAILVPRLGGMGGAWAIVLSLSVWAIAAGGVLWRVIQDMRPPHVGDDSAVDALGRPA